MLDKAIRIAAQAFEGRFDKGGQPYILHCLQVMYDTNSTDVDVKCAAVLHDLLEDCPDWTVQRLLAEGFNLRVIELVKKLTHKKEAPYQSYIEAIATDPDATEIKKADLRHNSQIMRIKDVRKKDFDRLQRYYLAYKYLSE